MQHRRILRCQRASWHPRLIEGSPTAIRVPLQGLKPPKLRRRKRLDTAGQDESHFLETLTEIAASGRTPAEQLLEDYETRWHRRIDPVFAQEAY